MVMAILAAASGPLSAQIFADKSPAAPPAGAGATAVAQAAAPASRILKAVEFYGANLSEVIASLQEKSKKLGIDPAVDPLNVVISPGLEGLILPTLSLRNVSPTDVLNVVAAVLGLQLEPVNGDSGTPVAWLIKPQPGADPFANGPAPGAGASNPPPPGAGTYTSPQGPSSGGRIGSPSSFPGGSPPGPAVMELAALPGIAAAPASPQARVFGIAALLKPSRSEIALGKWDSSENGRQERLDVLKKTLHDIALELCPNAGDVEVRSYSMDILVVRTKDPAALDLIASAIEAMKSNASAGAALPVEKSGKPEPPR